MKFAFIILFSLLTIQAFTQTKEETIQWINDYGTETFDKDITFFQCEKDKEVGSERIECKDNFIILTKVSRYYVDGQVLWNETSVYRVNLNDVFVQEVPVAGEKALALSIKTKKAAVGITTTNVDKIMGTTTETHTGDALSLWFSKDPISAQRVAKAIIHLAQLSGAPGLPKVNKNAF